MDKVFKRFSTSYKDLKVSSEPECRVNIEKHGSTISLASWLDEHAYTKSIENILQKDGSIRLVGEQLTYLPEQILHVFGHRTTSLNLSDNQFKDLNFLSHFPNLHTLILNKNKQLDENTLPYMPSLRALWINNCEFANILKWVKKIKLQCPDLIVLSITSQGLLMSPRVCKEERLQRLKIIRHLPNLCILDNMEITPNDVDEALAMSENVFNRVFSVFRKRLSGCQTFDVEQYEENSE